MTTKHALTARQQQVLELIRQHIDDNGYPPTLRELARQLGVSGTLPVSKHLEALQRKGYLSRSNDARGICLTGSAASAVSLPIVGTVRAGALTPAIEDIQGYLALDRLQLHGGTFLLRVAGDSMINAAICDGDLALVRPQPTAENRDIVVAMVEGEATLKEFHREKGQIRLQPKNPNMDPIIVKEGSAEVTIVGKVVGIFRSMA
ncbi:transcriptional repressor LexA [Trichlorobacter sp.]|uniref:transcriptional repressor LexA n=1 Tax=Trichlorobacter sp. TaxID=2911007 RepID=UPI002A36BDA2|nr:transcriptional repressor LexA [Trichlorobacter sp.]MDY0383610.1 transcriptional repressor LexA [Trichlorobacter sp.]